MADIRNIRPYGAYPPKKIYRVIDGKLVEIKKAYRCINGALKVVWDVGSEPPTPVVTGMRTVWRVQNSAHSLVFPALSVIGVDGMIDWGDGTVEQCNSGINLSHNYADDGEYTVTVNYEITELRDYAFQEVDATDKRDYTLLECYMSDNITKIGDYAFEYCKFMRKIVLSENLVTVGICAFHYTSALDTVEFPPSAVDWVDGGNLLFWVSGVTHIDIPYGVTKLKSTFDLCANLEKVTIPNSVTRLEWYLFNYCQSLRVIDIPSSVTTMYTSSIFSNTSSELVIRIHKPKGSISGEPWGAWSATIQWLG